MIATKPLGSLYSHSSNTSVLYFISPHGPSAPRTTCYMNHLQTRKLIRRVIKNHAFPVYSFNLDKVLRLNITLQNIFFSHKNFPFDNQCRFQFIDIVSNSSAHCKYCGILPEFQNFPDSHVVRLEVRSFAITIVKVAIFYSIIDVNLIKSGTPSAHQINDMYSFGGVFVSSRYHVIVSSYVKTDHYKRIVLTSSFGQNWLQVHDGPGSLSKILHSSNSQDTFFYLSSTFQIFVFVLLPDAFKYSNRAVQFVSQFHKVQIVNISTTQSKIHLPNTNACYENKVCIFILQTKHPLKLNISLHNVIYHGVNNTQDCLYAGLATYDWTVNKFIHTNTYCVVHMFVSSSNVTCFRGMAFYPLYSAFHFSYSSPHWYRHPYSSWETYSKANRMLMVFYSYTEYGSFEIHITARATACNVMHFDQCNSITRDVVLPWNQKCSVFVFTHQNITTCDETFLTYFQISFASESEDGKQMFISGYGTFRGQ